VRVSAEEWAARRQPREKQIEGFDVAKLHKASVEAKVFPAWRGSRADSFRKCGREKLYRECNDCRDVKEFDYHCNLKWCPCCNWRTVHVRTKELRAITTGISTLRHAVLTQRNFEHLTRSKIIEARKNLSRLRRSKLFKPVRGGCCSLEFTNESRGWHMHWHLLLDVRFVDEQELSKQWGSYVGQEFAICRCRAVGDTDYVREVSKYVVEGSEIAGWPAEIIVEFLQALDATRLFSVFGDWKQRRKAAAATLHEEYEPPVCDCGCSSFTYGDDLAFINRDIRKGNF